MDKLLGSISSLYQYKTPGTIDAGDAFYDETADFYVSIFARNKHDDIPLYLSIARQTGSPVLEAACGDGRVLVPLAQNGFTVYGCDTSPSLLRFCRDRMQKLQPDERLRIRLIRSGLQHIPLKRVFNLALVPYNSFNHLLDENDQRSCLNGLFRALQKDGVLVMEILPYHESYFTGLRARQAGTLSDGQTRISAFSQVVQNKSNATHTVYWYLTIKKPGAPPRRVISNFTRKDMPLSQIKQLVTEAGFTIKEIRYSYSGATSTNDKRIIIARKP